MSTLRTSLSLALVLALVLCLAACESSGGAADGSGSATDATATDATGGVDATTLPDGGGPGLDAQQDSGASTPDTAGVDAPPVDAGGPDVATADTGPDVPETPVVCTAGSRWTPGTGIFVERTEEWGLAGIGAQGTRLSVVDIDGDGWADLLVRRGGTRHDELTPDGARHTWLLRNVPGAGFEDVTLTSGVLTTRQPHDPAVGRPNQVFAMADVDNDGDLDLYSGCDTVDATVSLGETSELLLNDGTGHFTLGPEDNPLRRAGAVDMPASASFVDYDRDGKVDVWIGEHNYDGSGGLVFQQDRLFRGDGAGGFVDVTADVGLTTQDWRYVQVLNEARAHTRSWSTAACDLNGDGMPELLSASYGRSPNHLWQGDPGFDTYVNQSVASGYAYDDNLRWDDNQFARCFCASNRDAEGCALVPPAAITCSQTNWVHEQDREPFRLGGNSGATVCADIDNDGDIDLLTTEIRHWWAGLGADGSEVLVNEGGDDVIFDRPGDEALGLAIPQTSSSWDEGHMTAAIFDFDNDGWNDIYVGASDYAGNRGLLYHQDTALAFTEVGTADFFEHNRSHGVVVADFDHDGDLDIAVGHSRSRCDASLPNDCYPTQQVRIFENVFGQDGNWLQVRLHGGPSVNRAAIGARVTVTAGGVTQTQEVDGGHGHYNTQKDIVLHFGLGSACEAEVSVRWPNRALTTQTATLGGGYRYDWTFGYEPQVVGE